MIITQENFVSLIAKTFNLSLICAALLTSGAAPAMSVAWEVLESPIKVGNPPDDGWYDVQLTVRNHVLEGAITAFAVGVSDANVWAYTTRPGWQPSGNQGVHHAETWSTDGYDALFGGMSWDTFTGGQTRTDGSNYSWFAIYYLDASLGPGSGIAQGQGSGQFSYTTNYFPASPAAIGLTDSQGQVTGYAGQTTLVPEPETWAMLLAGLGLVGWATRKRQAPR